MREALAVVWLQCPDKIAVERPRDSVLGVLHGVGVEIVQRRAVHVVVDASVVSGGAAFGEPVGLELVGITAKQLDVDLVQVVALEIEGRDDTLSLGGLHHHLDLAEHDVEVGLDGRVVKALGDFQLQAIVRVRQAFALDLVKVL